ncbi:MAG: glycoside hydrolase family 3 N-terminal domain-containing protein [Enterocloster sp.]
MNIFRDPRWGRGHETFGEDPYLSGRLGVGFIKGVQGRRKYLLAAACAKHFAVHSSRRKSAMNLMPESARKTFGRHICLRLKHVWWRGKGGRRHGRLLTGRTGSHAAAVRL